MRGNKVYSRLSEDGSIKELNNEDYGYSDGRESLMKNDSHEGRVLSACQRKPPGTSTVGK